MRPYAAGKRCGWLGGLRRPLRLLLGCLPDGTRPFGSPPALVQFVRGQQKGRVPSPTPSPLGWGILLFFFGGCLKGAGEAECGELGEKVPSREKEAALRSKVGHRLR